MAQLTVPRRAKRTLLLVIAWTCVARAGALTEVTGSKPPFPAGIPITESELILTLVPEVEEQVKNLETSGVASDEARLRAGRVDDWILTDFGMPRRSFLVAAVGGETGICAQCFVQRIGVFSLPDKRLVFRSEREGIGPEPSLRVFRLFPGDSTLTLAFQTGEGSLNMGGYSRSREEWHRLVVVDAQVKFHLVWSGVVYFAVTDNASLVSQSECAKMTRIEGTRRYRCLVRDRYGYLGGEPVQPSSNDGEDTCLCRQCGIEIRRDQIWEFAPAPTQPARLISEIVRRIDGSVVDVFPFDLPVRSVSWHRKSKTTAARTTPGFAEVRSPTGSKAVKWDASDAGTWSLQVVGSDEQLLRAVTLPKPAIASPTPRSVLATVVALGWQADERRFFAVIEYGSENRALVSFDVNDGRDYWERPLPAGDTWPYGFVLEGARPASKAVGE